MTNKNFLSKIRGLSRALQSSDVGFDCRSTVGSPSGFHRSTVLKLCTVLVLVLTIGVGNAWGATYSGSFVNYTGTLIDGYYLIVASNSASSNANYAMGSTADSNKRIAGTSVTISSNTISNPNDQLVFLIESNAAGTGFCFKNYNTSNYVFYAANSSGKSLNYGTTAYYHTLSGYNSTSPVGYKFTIAGTAAGSNNVLKYNTSNKWFSGYSGAYSTSMTPVRLFRLAKFRAKTTQPASGSFTASATSATWDTPNKHLSWMSSGATVTLTAAPPSGKAVNAWTIKNSAGTDITSTVSLSGHTNTATFSMPADQVTISVTWKDSGTSVSLSKAATSNGSFSLSSDGPLNTATAQTITVTGTPNTGYYLSGVTQSGASSTPTITKTSATTYTIQYPASCTGTSTITATFSPIWYLKGDFNTWGNTLPLTDITSNVATVDVGLSKTTAYEFKVYNAQEDSWYGNNGKIIDDISGWEFSTDKGNCKVFATVADDYTFKFNISNRQMQIIYPDMTHPNDAYVYLTKWWDCYVHYWYTDGEGDHPLIDWGYDTQLSRYEEICETNYWCVPILDGYPSLIMKDNAGDPSNTTGDQTTASNAGKYITHNGVSWGWHDFDRYDINFGGNGNTGGEMSSITDLCPGSNRALTSNAFIKTHYTFSCWHADVAVKVGESTISAGGDISNGATIKDIQSDINLTAQWSPVSYTITKTLTNVANAGLPASFTYTGATTTALNSSFTVDGTNFFLPSSITVTMGGETLTEGSGKDYTYNSSSGAFTFDVAITGNIVITATAVPKLKSIAITTPPTTRAYLVGESFSSTGAVVTATMGDGSTKAVTASATWTPAGALSAGTSQTVTATYTEAGIEKTATTTIDVYSVTVNKVNMSGTAIADAGVTASCSGRTLSQSVSTTNYKFNSWVVTAGGVSVSTNTITGTPTGNVTINAKFHDPITVTWKVGSGAASGSPTTEVKYNTAITALPSTPADNALASCGTNKFMGWTAAGELKGTGHSAPADLFTTVGGATALTENTTYRAVFASSTSGAAAGTTIYSEDFSGYSADDQPNGSITNSHTGTTVYGGNTLTYSYSDGNGTTKIFAANLAGGTSPELLIAKYSGYFQIAGIPTGNASVLTLTYKQNGQSITSSVSGTGYSGGKTSSSAGTTTTDITVGTAETFTLRLTGPSGNNNVRLDDILITVKTAGTTAVDYQTGCCEAPASALSITSANSVATGGTVSLTSTGGNGGTVTWSVVNGTGTATVAGTTLTAGSIGTVTVKAHQDANTVLGTEYCAQDAEQAFTVVSSTINVTGVEVSPTTKAIVPGETFDITPTISPSNATDKSVSWTSSASDKASVSSGTVTGVAAGTATITCTTTDGSYTATTAVTVYGVTMQALDEDGNAIAVGGPGTPSRTGASISPAADAGNYVFKEWAISGASLGSSASTKANTITNPTGAVTVTAKYYKPRTVKWSVNGNDSYNTGSPTTTVAYNGTISTVPTAPADNTLSCTNKFMGWSTKDAGTTPKTTSYYDDLFTNASGYTTNITAATTTFYAVFAEAETGAWTLDYSEETALSSSTDWGSYGTAYDYTASDGGTWTVKAYKNAGMQINTTKDASIKIPDCSGNITSIVITCSAAKAVGLSASDYTGSGVITYIAYGTDATSQTIDCSGASATGGYIVPKGGSTSITKIVVNYGSTSNYVTQCDANIVRVTYDANGGSTTCENTTTDKTEDYTVCSSAPTKDYYSFAGWLCSADDEVYAASTTIDDAVIDADFTLTAQWTPVTYNITYELDGGTNNVGNPATYNVTTATITLQDPTKGHDRFEGWYSTYSAGVYSDPVTEIPLGSHDNITLYAKWTERHEIVFDADGETTTIYRADDENMEDAVAGQGSVPSDPSAPSTCSTKVFVGWSESEIDDETNTRPGDLMKPAEGKVDEDKHYYAVWALRAGSPAPATYAGTGTFVKITSMSEVETDTYYVLRGIDGSTVKVMKNTISSGKMGTADDPVSENVITNPGVAIVWKLGGKKDAYTLYNQSVSKYVEITGNSTGGYALNASPTSGATYTLTIEDGHGFFFKSNYSTANSRGISIYNASEFRSYGLANAKTLELYKLPAYTYSAYSTSCCETKVNLTHNSPEHGTVEFNKSRIGTCNSDKEVSLTITPDAGYKLTGWTVNTTSGYADAKTTSPAVVTTNNNSATQNITLTFAQDANKNYDVSATFGLMSVESWTWTYNSAAMPNPLNLYIGQSARLDVAYTPAGVDNSKKTYTRTKEDAYINWVGVAQSTYTTISGRASTGENTTPVTFTHSDGPTTTVNVKVLPLPAVHFGDIVHNVEFADVVATLSDNALSPTKTTPTHADFDGATKNTCEEQHLHLVGWIREDWPSLVTYLNGGAKPSTDDITGAGNDGSGNAYFFTPGASINTQTFNGVTFYAVWAKVE